MSTPRKITRNTRKSLALQEHITHTNAMIAICHASNLPQTEEIYRAQLARLTEELNENQAAS